MKIHNLATLSTEDIVECLLCAFSNYFVELPTSTDYWENRFKAARVDRELSFGMFDGEKLVGFIIHGIDKHDGKLTAFNSGTGVRPEYRGKAIVDQLYAHALPAFKDRGIQKCMLEVIQENERALKVYRRIGFEINRSLISLKGSLPEAASGYHLLKTDFQHILELNLYRPHLYSWDNMAEAVQISKYQTNVFLVLDEDVSLAGYIVMGPDGKVVQLDVVGEGELSEVIKSLSGSFRELKFGNIPQERKNLLNILESQNFENTVNQFEMEFLL